MGDFSSQVNAWALATEARTAAVFKDAAQTVANEVRTPLGAGGNMPIDTGNLRRSLTASRDVMPSIKVGADTFADGSSDISLTIAGANLGDTIYIGFQAAYARRVNYGFTGVDSLGRKYNQAGRHFVELTAQRWPQIVAASNLKIQKAVQSRASGGMRGTVARQARSSR